MFFVRAQNGGKQGGKKSKCRKPDKRKQDGPIHKSFSYAPSCHGKGSAFILYCLCRLFYISHKKPALSPGFHQAYLLICSYGIIGWGFAGLYGKAKERAVYPLTLLMTILGMVCRYVLEYGEASNVYNFTMLNILSYIILIPAFTVGAYHYIVKYLISAR